MEIIGYKYNTEQEAYDKRENVDSYYGIPVSPEDITQNWVDYLEASLNEPVFWYINFNDSLLPILGQPETFEVFFNSPI
ncbi:MAG: hypothetical protein EBX50_22800 [Chitinophagia bacterium]|nr:hypothetical protein [Chitinophagia bacterium]